jgi:hypothetical protein
MAISLFQHATFNLPLRLLRMYMMMTSPYHRQRRNDMKNKHDHDENLLHKAIIDDTNRVFAEFKNLKLIDDFW